MSAEISMEHIAALAATLPPTDRLRLIERISRELAAGVEETQQSRPDWMSLRGIAPRLFESQDAQEWVSESRRHSDDHPRT